MMIPGLKVVVPSNATDVIGLMAASVRDNDPVIFLEAKALYASKMDVPDGEIVDTLGSAKVLREGTDATVVALGAMVPKALAAAEELSNAGIECTVVDVRSLVPLDMTTILREVSATGRLFTVEENPRLCGWGGELSSIVSERPSTTSTDRSFESRRHTYRCPRPTRLRTWRFLRLRESSPRSPSR